MSFRSAPCARSSYAAGTHSACTAFTRDDLPMPRAPQRSALLAGSPAANRRVFSRDAGAVIDALEQPSGTRLTWATGSKTAASGCQMKASARRNRARPTRRRQPLEGVRDPFEARDQDRLSLMRDIENGRGLSDFACSERVSFNSAGRKSPLLPSRQPSRLQRRLRNTIVRHFSGGRRRRAALAQA